MHGQRKQHGGTLTKLTLDGLPGVPLCRSLQLDGPGLGSGVVALGGLLVVLLRVIEE